MTIRLEVQDTKHRYRHDRGRESEREQCYGFKLSWGNGQQIPSAFLPPSKMLTEAYQRWQEAYLRFYKTFRGRTFKSGSFSDAKDWRSELVKAEAELLAEFHDWLRDKELDPIRRQIAQIARDYSKAKPSKAEDDDDNLTIFLTCNSIELARLPWEAWEIGKELATTTTLRIARTPDLVRAEPMKTTRQGRNRVLVILGDDTGLDFKKEQEAVRSLSRIAEIRFVGWQPGKDTAGLLAEITQAITDEAGWDILLFAGHSNEAQETRHQTEGTGGELGIAPNLAIHMREIAPQLTFAKQKGLQFALINSCNGLSIAKSLIDLGFNQVAVMREPIHNQVAQEFLVQFLRSMGDYHDVHESLLAASRFLKVEKALTYPAASSVPSLYCRPGQELFRFRRFGWKDCFRRWLPTRRQAIVLSGLAILSLAFPVQGALLDQRIWAQALYRRATGQVANTTTPVPPIALVQVDNQSLQKAGITNPNPMSRTYLAQMIDRLSEANVQVIGLDYLLDRTAIQPEDDQVIAQSIESAVAKGTWFVFVTYKDNNGEWAKLLPNTYPEASPITNWSLYADPNVIGLGDGLNFLPIWVTTAYPFYPGQPLPFAYLLTLSKRLTENPSPDLPQPNLNRTDDFLADLKNHLQAQGEDPSNLVSPRSQLLPITILSYWFQQVWLHPVIDFSLKPEQVYQSIPAWRLLESADSGNHLSPQPDQVVIVAAGGYDEAGLGGHHSDNMALPKAVRHWRLWQPERSARLDRFTGGETHAYMLYQLLTQRLVVPIPDLWMLLLFALLGKATVLALHKRPFHQQRWLILLTGSTAAYGLISLQLYISAAILLPWLIPSIAFWIYTLPLLAKKKA